MARPKTPQEQFWAGEFGDEYIARSRGDHLVAANINLFAHALRTTDPIRSCVELGANIGLNLRALRILYPEAHLSGVEINTQAAAELRDVADVVEQCSIFDWTPGKQWDLALIKLVLIHINPELLAEVYSKLYQASKRYILVAEYFNPTPVEVNYRGHADRLFKRDFAGEILDAYPDLRLVDYGFCYKRDKFSQDDLNWFLLQKTQTPTS